MMDDKLDRLKTRLRDIVFGRTKIQVVREEDFSGFRIKPIFVIGCFRSGTTLVRFFLDSHRRIACPPESKFLKHLAQFIETGSTVSAIKDMGFDEVYLRDRFQRFANSFFLSYMLAHGKSRWADKTPDYVRCLNFIEWLYGPICQYVMIYRNGLDVAESINSIHVEPLEQGKDLPKAFNYWAEDVRIMLDWEKTQPERCHRILYEHMCQETEPVLRGLFDFLGEDWDPDVLKWYEKPHDRGQEDIKARRQRGIRLSHGKFKKWDWTLQKEFKERSRNLHEAIGYDPETLMPVRP